MSCGVAYAWWLFPSRVHVWCTGKTSICVAQTHSAHCVLFYVGVGVGVGVGVVWLFSKTQARRPRLGDGGDGLTAAVDAKLAKLLPPTAPSHAVAAPSPQQAPATPEGHTVTSLLRVASSGCSEARRLQLAGQDDGASSTAAPERSGDSGRRVLAEANALATSRKAAVAEAAAAAVAASKARKLLQPEERPRSNAPPSPRPSGTATEVRADGAASSPSRWRTTPVVTDVVMPPRLPHPDPKFPGGPTDPPLSASFRAQQWQAQYTSGSEPRELPTPQQPQSQHGPRVTAGRSFTSSLVDMPHASPWSGGGLSFADASRVVEARRLWRESRSLCPAPPQPSPFPIRPTASSAPSATAVPATASNAVTVTLTVPQPQQQPQQQQQQLLRRPQVKPVRRKGKAAKGSTSSKASGRSKSKAPSARAAVVFGSSRSRSTGPPADKPRSAATKKASRARLHPKQRLSATAAAPPEAPAVAPPPSVAPPPLPQPANYDGNPRSRSPATSLTTVDSPPQAPAEPVVPPSAKRSRGTTPPPQPRPCVGCSARDRRLEAAKAAADTRYQQQLARHQKERSHLKAKWKGRLEEAQRRHDQELATLRARQAEALELNDEANKDVESAAAQQVAHTRGLLKLETARLERARTTVEELKAEK